MRKVKGRDILVFGSIFDGRPGRTFKAQTSAELKESFRLQEKLPKESARCYRKRTRQWSLALSMKLATAQQLKELYDKLHATTPEVIYIAKVEPHEEENEIDYIPMDGLYIQKGKAYLSGLTITAKMGAVCDVKTTWTGTGPLEYVPAEWILEQGEWNDQGIWTLEGIWKTNN